MRIDFNMKLFDGTMEVTAEYEKNELSQGFFYLNRDFSIKRCEADGRDYDIGAELIPLEFLNGYQVKKYTLPENFNKITVSYTGVLTGKTGACPYVRETISPEFSFIRWESFCYPIFFRDDRTTLIDFLTKKVSTPVTVSVTVPRGFTVVSSGKFTSKQNISGNLRYTYEADCRDIDAAMSRYIKKTLNAGIFYLSADIDCTLLDRVITSAHGYMNERFGKRDISSEVNYAAIPERFGSFARPRAVFIDETAFNSVKSMNQIIHEFIHLGWNVPADKESESIRFFDEAFTSYFECRVMESLTGSGLYDMIQARRYLPALSGAPIPPLAEYGKRGCSDYSYTVGALCLHEMSLIIGTELFDKATKAFLEKYRQTPVNLKVFCDEYKTFCKTPGLDKFYEDWIYSAEGPMKFIAGL